ncbi:unnamed protein product [Closterium sp. NIES-64]|nr:unnamed protein product [Closterium sp. NIES-64]
MAGTDMHTKVKASAFLALVHRAMLSVKACLNTVHVSSSEEQHEQLLDAATDAAEELKATVALLNHAYETAACVAVLAALRGVPSLLVGILLASERGVRAAGIHPCAFLPLLSPCSPFPFSPHPSPIPPPQEAAACVALLAALRGFPSSLVAVSLASERGVRRARASIGACQHLFGTTQSPQTAMFRVLTLPSSNISHIATSHHRHESSSPRVIIATSHHRHESSSPLVIIAMSHHRHESSSPRVISATRLSTFCLLLLSLPFRLHTLLPEPPGLPLEQQHMSQCVQALAQAIRVFLDSTAMLLCKLESQCESHGTQHEAARLKLCYPMPPPHATTPCHQPMPPHTALPCVYQNTAMLLCKLESQCESHGMRLLELKRCIQPVSDGVRVLTPTPVVDGVRVLTPIVRGVEDEGWGSTEVLDMLHAARYDEESGMKRWMQEGRLDDDIHSEFFISSCTTAATDALTSTATDVKARSNTNSPATTTSGSSAGLRLRGHGGAQERDGEVLFQSVADDVLGTGQLVHALRQHGYLKQLIPDDVLATGQLVHALREHGYLKQLIPDDVLATGQLVHALREHGYLKQCYEIDPFPHSRSGSHVKNDLPLLRLFLEGEAQQPQMQLGSLEESVGARTQAVQQTMIDLTLNKADYLSDFMALAGEELCKPARRASQARIDLSLGASLRSSMAANDPNCDRLSARLVPVDPPSPSTSSLHQQPLQPLQSQSPPLQRAPDPPVTSATVTSATLTATTVTSAAVTGEHGRCRSAEQPPGVRSIRGPTIDDADGDFDASHAAAGGGGSGDDSGGGGNGGGGGDGDDRQLYSNPLSLLPQLTPVRPVSPAAAAAAQAARGERAERRGASGESGWEAIYIDYQAPWPVSAVVPLSALQGYNRLFRFLLASLPTYYPPLFPAPLTPGALATGALASIRSGAPIRTAGLQPPLPLPARFTPNVLPTSFSAPLTPGALASALASIRSGARNGPSRLQSPLPLPARRKANPPAPRPQHGLPAGRAMEQMMLVVIAVCRPMGHTGVRTKANPPAFGPQSRMVCPVADAGSEGGRDNDAARALAAASHGVISPNFDLMTTRLTKATSFHQKLSSLLSIALRFATTVSTTIHTASSLPGLDSSSSSSAAAGGGWGGGGRGGYGAEGRTSGGELADYAYGDATSDAKGRAARAAFRRQLAAEELQRGLEQEGFVEEMRATHTAFTASLRAAIAAIASALRDHPLLLSLHLALTAVAKGLP